MGILLFELFVGYPPFEGDGAMDLYAKIVSADVKYPKKITPHAQALLRMLLHPSQTERLGSLKGGAEDVKQYAHQKLPTRTFAPVFTSACRRISAAAYVYLTMQARLLQEAAVAVTARQEDRGSL
jgi:hypothetical protein